MYVSVVLECKKQGIAIGRDREAVLKAVDDVMKFFTMSKMVDGAAAKCKSICSVVKPSGKRGRCSDEEFQKLWSAVRDFEESRDDEKCVIISCDERDIANCVKSGDKPNLLISATDLNSKDFSKQL